MGFAEGTLPPYLGPHALPPAFSNVMLKAMSETIFDSRHQQLFVRQRKEWTEILIDWETRNQYSVMTAEKAEIATVVEKSRGFGDFLARSFLRSHRPFEIGVFEPNGGLLFKLVRSFFFFFSNLEIQDNSGRVLGRVQRRFGLLYRKYDLYDDAGSLFARIKGPIWRIWTFPVTDTRGLGEANIAKRWGGGLREIFTDADAFLIDYMGGHWSENERRVIFSAAISIDFDFFEDNQRN
ncbi:MAG: hypothetical protein JRG94_12130 [Deltaproteobacteria bacterium]|nr:hypothetical protein [Deltaproteobacteria bacterium]